MTTGNFLQLSVELQRIAEKTPLHWGKVQNNHTDHKINLFACKTLDSLESKIQDLPVSDQRYFKRRWFLWQCAQVDECLFCQEKNVVKNPNSKDQSWDIVFNNTHFFDLKGTVVPKSLRKGFQVNETNEKDLINFYYDHQSKGVRNKLQNRLFIVHHSFHKNERSMYLRCHWELKKMAYQAFNDRISSSSINLIKHRSVFAKCIFLIESELNAFSYQII